MRNLAVRAGMVTPLAIVLTAGATIASNMGFKLNVTAINALLRGSGINVTQVSDDNQPAKTSSVGIDVDPLAGVGYQIAVEDGDYMLQYDRSVGGDNTAVIEPVRGVLAYSADGTGILRIMYGHSEIVLEPRGVDESGAGYFGLWVNDVPMTVHKTLTVTDNNVPDRGGG